MYKPLSRSTDYMTDPCHDDPTAISRVFGGYFFGKKSTKPFWPHKYDENKKSAHCDVVGHDRSSF